MLNEGIVMTDTASALRAEMVRQIRELGEATPDRWERAVFQALTGHTREEVDWDAEDNQAGYFTWLKSFDHHAGELVEDGFVSRIERDGRALFKAVETDETIAWSPMVAGQR